jgi:hypothetical protein
VNFSLVQVGLFKEVLSHEHLLAKVTFASQKKKREEWVGMTLTYRLSSSHTAQ